MRLGMPPRPPRGTDAYGAASGAAVIASPLAGVVPSWQAAPTAEGWRGQAGGAKSASPRIAEVVDGAHRFAPLKPTKSAIWTMNRDEVAEKKRGALLIAPPAVNRRRFPHRLAKKYILNPLVGPPTMIHQCTLLRTLR